MSCVPCGKSFNSKGAYDNHVASKKHKEIIAAEKADTPGSKAYRGGEGEKIQKHAGASSTAPGAAAAAASSSGDTPMPQAAPAPSSSTQIDGKDEEQLIDEYLSTVERLTVLDCIFSGKKFETFQETMDYVTLHHSFYIPDIEYVKDLEGLYQYYADKVAVGRTCIFCNQQFGSLEAVRLHMKDKGHSRIKYDDDNEDVDEFYDYSSSYEGTGIVPTNEEGISQLSPEAGALILPPGASRKPVDLTPSGYGLVLSDGSTIGHRAMKHLYRQKYIPPSRRANAGRSTIEALREKYRMLGWHGDVSTFSHNQVTRHAQRKTKMMSMQLGQKANKLQHYFRLQNPM